MGEQKQGLKYFIDIAQVTKVLLENIGNKLNIAEINHLLPKFQDGLLKKNADFFLGIENNIKEMLALAKTKLRENKKKYNLLLKEKNMFSQISDFKENYSSEIEQNWYVSQELILNKNNLVA